jgi:ABC-type uncharacterized transport system permease subunit
VLNSASLIGLILGGAIASGTPVLFATTGEVLAERSGVVNLGLEGSMLLGGVSAAYVQLATGNAVLAIGAGLLGGAVLGLLHGLLVVIGQVDVLASGLCLFFVGRGFSAFWGQQIVGQQLSGFSPWYIPLFGRIPVVGEAFFRQDPLVYLAAILAVSTWFILFRTHAGLLIRAAGEGAAVAYAEGVPVGALRILCVTLGSGLAGLGGADIVLSFAHTWLNDLVAGRGWVAIGLVILARWNPLYALPIAYVFGGVMSLQLNAQAAGLHVSPYLMSMLPYLFTVLALMAAQWWSHGSGMPMELTRTSG